MRGRQCNVLGPGGVPRSNIFALTPPGTEQIRKDAMRLAKQKQSKAAMLSSNGLGEATSPRSPLRGNPFRGHGLPSIRADVWRLLITMQAP